MSEVVAGVVAGRAFARGGYGRALGIAVGLTGLADFLFYGEWPGFSALLFGLAVGAGAALWRAPAPGGRRWVGAGCVLGAAFAPWLAGPGFIAFVFALLGSAYGCAVIGSGPWPPARAAWFVMRGMVWRVLADGAQAGRAARMGRGGWSAAGLVVWAMPLGLGFVFVALFSAANPLIESGLGVLNPGPWLAGVTWGRVLFWLFVISAIWPFVAVRVRAFPRAQQDGRSLVPASGLWALLFGQAAVLRALVLFNLLFGVQTVLDLVFLWSGRRLPDGLSYADYAHRGAYPLIFTALLAGVFAILASRPETEVGRSRLVRALVLVWIGQNLLLTGSAILRLKFYVAAYALTELRLAAFVWMGLVAAGLALIVARVVWGRPTGWLVRANVLVLGVTLYVCGFVNFPEVVAMYDVRHCVEVAGDGPPLDVDYVESLGPQAIPALDFYAVRTEMGSGKCVFSRVDASGFNREGLVEQLGYDARDWRGWDFWSWELAMYLGAHRAACG